ncbi:MAG: DUF4845 domain-containing protein [Aquabacterium sp.]
MQRVRLRRAGQRGVSLIGLLMWAIVIGFIGYVLVRAVPTINEYMTIQRAVKKIAAAPPATVGEIRNAFDKQRDIEYAISSITGRDLEITKVNDKVVISFKYDKEIELIAPVYLLLRYAGSSE